MKDLASELMKIAKSLVASKEYVIWGVPPKPHPQEDTLLLSRVEGEPITDKADAKKYMKVLEEKHGAKKLRIQEIDLEGEFDWLKETGLKKASSDRDLEKHIAEIRKMTQMNDHNMSLAYLYEHVLKDRFAARACEAVETLNAYFGEMPRELSELRRKKLYDPAMDRVRHKFLPETAERIYMSF